MMCKYMFVGKGECVMVRVLNADRCNEVLRATVLILAYSPPPMTCHWTPEILPSSSEASWSNAAGEKFKSYLLQPTHSSTILTVTCLPLSVRF